MRSFECMCEMKGKHEFVKHIVSIPKSIKYVVISSPRSTLLDFKWQWTTHGDRPCLGQCLLCLYPTNIQPLNQTQTIETSSSWRYTHFFELLFNVNGDISILWVSDDLGILLNKLLLEDILIGIGPSSALKEISRYYIPLELPNTLGMHPINDLQRYL